ncbi:MAG: SGNH/GDSL hydrolase family protein [Planctomycetes bacterium]|nr:SGNH/GDSL hydrolase family protein [Planctomycetota bacterium]
MRLAPSPAPSFLPSSPRPARREGRRRLGLPILASLLGTLFALEVGARIYARATLRERGLAFDPDLGWRPLPNVRKRGRYWGGTEPATTNSKGWRDAEHSYAKEPGLRRIVALGDSFLFGQGVDYGERFTERLEGAFPRLEVVNLGVTGYGTDQELRLLEIEGTRYGPDLVLLVALLENDLDDIRHERKFSWPRPTYALVGEELRFSPARATWEVRARTASYLAEFVFGRFRRAFPVDRRAPQWEWADTVPLFAGLVRRMAEVCAGRATRFLVLLAHPQWRLAGPLPDEQERAIGALAESRIPTLPTQEAFSAGVREGESLYLEDGHWNARGHQLAADVVRRRLVADGWAD